MRPEHRPAATRVSPVVREVSAPPPRRVDDQLLAVLRPKRRRGGDDEAVEAECRRALQRRDVRLGRILHRQPPEQQLVGLGVRLRLQMACAMSSASGKNRPVRSTTTGRPVLLVVMPAEMLGRQLVTP